MSVDMFRHRFVAELCKLEPFCWAEDVSAEVRAIDFPAWRAVFTANLMCAHSSGYRLPEFEMFVESCRSVFLSERHRSRFEKWFSPRFFSKSEQRLRWLYESGVAEAYFYSCIVEAIEDKSNDGFVFYDPRMDWKHKGDLWITRGPDRFRVDSFWGDAERRGNIMKGRDETERVRKVNTVDSSHWPNHEHEYWISLGISRSAANCHVVNAIRLFSVRSVNGLLRDIYSYPGQEHGYVFPSELGACYEG